MEGVVGRMEGFEVGGLRGEVGKVGLKVREGGGSRGKVKGY